MSVQSAHAGGWFVTHSGVLADATLVLLRRIAEEVPCPVAVYLAPDWRVIFANACFCRAAGAVSADLIGRPLAEVFPGLREAGLLSALEAARSTVQSVPVRAGWASLRPGEPATSWDFVLHPLPEADGSVDAVLFMAQDTTAEVRARQQADMAREKLARRAEQMRLAIDAARMFFWDYDVATGTLEWSEGLAAACGLAPGTTGGTSEAFRALVHPDDLTRVDLAMQRALAGEADYDIEFRMRRADGDFRWLLARGTVLRDPAGRPVRVVGIDLDLTERMRAITDSRALSEARFQAVFDSTADHMFVVRVTTDRRFIYEAVNPAWTAAMGLPLERVRGLSPVQVLGERDGGAATADMRRAYESGQPYRCEPTWRMPDGAVTCDTVYLPLRDTAGDVVSILGIARDVTASRHMEAALRQAPKMHALGQLAGGVAHNFNNLLTTILGSLELLERHVTSEKGNQFLAEGRRAGQLSASIVARLLAFSRPHPVRPVPVELNPLMENMIELLGRSLGPAIHIVPRLADCVWPVVADRNQLEVAILNLALNARDAMPQGGTLEFQTGNAAFEEAQAEGVGPGDFAAVMIRDSGAGMTPETLARTSDPFFTTKNADTGAGLGLATVRWVVQRHGGGMRIASAAGQGTCVTMFLPRARDIA